MGTGTSLTTLTTELNARLRDTSNGVWAAARKTSFINSAIRHANEVGALHPVIDSTTVVVASQLEYTVPAGIPSARAIKKVEIEGASSTAPYRTDLTWDTSETREYNSSAAETLTIKLIFPRAISAAAGKKIRVTYVTKHQELSAGADETSLPFEYVMAWAQFSAHNENRDDADWDKTYHQAEAPKFFQIAEKMLKEYSLTLPKIDDQVHYRVW